TGKATRVGKYFNSINDLAVSPDGKYLLVAGGELELAVYPLASPEKPLMQILASEGGDWIAWSRQGYYAGTPGGERLIGWRVTTRPDRPAMFYPAATFRKRLYRPDVIKELLPAGSTKAALAKLARTTKGKAPKERSVTIEDVLPPKVELSVKQ